MNIGNNLPINNQINTPRSEAKAPSSLDNSFLEALDEKFSLDELEIDETKKFRDTSSESFFSNHMGGLDNLVV